MRVPNWSIAQLILEQLTELIAAARVLRSMLHKWEWVTAQFSWTFRTLRFRVFLYFSEVSWPFRAQRLWAFVPVSSTKINIYEGKCCCASGKQEIFDAPTLSSFIRLDCCQVIACTMRSTRFQRNPVLVHQNYWWRLKGYTSGLDGPWPFFCFEVSQLHWLTFLSVYMWLCLFHLSPHLTTTQNTVHNDEWSILWCSIWWRLLIVHHFFSNGWSIIFQVWPSSKDKAYTHKIEQSVLITLLLILIFPMAPHLADLRFFFCFLSNSFPKTRE